MQQPSTVEEDRRKPSAATVYSPPELSGLDDNFSYTLEREEVEAGLCLYHLQISAEQAAIPSPLKLSWQFPAKGVKGVWSPAALYEKRLRADWEAPDLKSRISRHAPVLCLFGHRSENCLTFAGSDSLNTCLLSAPVREEDNLIYCSVDLFSEATEKVKDYELSIWVDTRNQNFSQSLQGVGQWWEQALGSRIAAAPPAIFDAVYSTWYAYHQEMSTDNLLAECRLAAKLGYGTIIVDDGWQTKDNQRGYDYTGDWDPDRFPRIADFVQEVHQLGMRAMLWYSVPFCGVKSRAYQQFKGKFLTENHRWAPVFDPRYPEVRSHLVSKYRQAVGEWGFDGLKLDFIDDFKVYPETPAGKADGRDFAGINAGVNQLLVEIAIALRAINPEVLIEFRQMYIGPSLRQLGNMFRAFDCPNDSATNRLRTTDVRLLIGHHAVHSDMFTWHPEEAIETAALQFTNILFSVPQLSVRLQEQSEEQLAMISFFTRYYNENRALLMNGDFLAFGPLRNYDLLQVSSEEKIIYGNYGRALVDHQSDSPVLDIINGTLEEEILIRFAKPLGICRVQQFNCLGELVIDHERDIPAGVQIFPCSPAGILQICALSKA
ncbi:MAG: glycoside hydrolase family 36 protein [Bacteroidota bacterium]